MDLLHDLIEVEEKGIITDLNESDTCANSKKLEMPQSFALKKSNHSDNMSQIVLEYHQIIKRFWVQANYELMLMTKSLT